MRPAGGFGVEDDSDRRVHSAEAIADRYAAYLRTARSGSRRRSARSAWSTSATYVHCAVGKDRTGVVSALLLKLAGAHDDDVIEDYLLTGRACCSPLRLSDDRPTPTSPRRLGLAQRPRRRDDACSSPPSGPGRRRSWLLHHDTDGETVDLLRLRLMGTRARALHAWPTRRTGCEIDHG